MKSTDVNDPANSSASYVRGDDDRGSPNSYLPSGKTLAMIRKASISCEIGRVWISARNEKDSGLSLFVIS